MHIFVNSKDRDVPESTTLEQLIGLLDLGQKRLAVEVNADLVVKAAWPAHVLKENDRVEIVSFVGGG